MLVPTLGYRRRGTIYSIYRAFSSGPAPTDISPCITRPPLYIPVIEVHKMLQGGGASDSQTFILLL